MFTQKGSNSGGGGGQNEKKNRKYGGKPLGEILFGWG